MLQMEIIILILFSPVFCIYMYVISTIYPFISGPPRLAEAIVGFQKTRVGRTIKLLCPVVGNPPPLTMWKKDGESINTLWERFKVLSPGLKIKNVEMADAGQYVCRATNGFGSVSINYTLTVMGKFFLNFKCYYTFKGKV